MGRIELGGETTEAILQELEVTLAEAQKTARRIQEKDGTLRADTAGDPEAEALAPELDGIMREMEAALANVKTI